jgi:hypothetical protein
MALVIVTGGTTGLKNGTVVSSSNRIPFTTTDSTVTVHMRDEGDYSADDLAFTLPAQLEALGKHLADAAFDTGAMQELGLALRRVLQQFDDIGRLLRGQRQGRDAKRSALGDVVAVGFQHDNSREMREVNKKWAQACGTISFRPLK